MSSIKSPIEFLISFVLSRQKQSAAVNGGVINAS